ncbi:MAG: putative porin, partial [Candidatus Omnitrophica bacterium]|nr:putative porin [Candidatus Omnitrophota bacterium]
GEFGNYELNLNYAYIEWSPVNEIKITGGKMKNPLYNPDQLLWDSDICFDGAVINSKYSIGDETKIDVYFNAGFFIIDYLGNASKNPYLAALQGGLGSSIEEIADWKLMAGYLDFVHIQNSKATGLAPVTGSANSESTNTLKYYAHDYNVVEVSGEMTFHLLEQELPAPFNKPLTLFGDMAWNTSGETSGIDPDKDTAYQLGVNYGKSPKALGEWNTGYNYVWFERNAFPDEFPNADMLRGGTNGYGHKIWLNVGLAKNWWLSGIYYALRDKSLTQPDNGDWGHIVQADVSVKF